MYSLQLHENFTNFFLPTRDSSEVITVKFSGGISVISHREAVANNPLLDGFDPSKPEAYILYIDANVSSPVVFY